MRRAEGWKSGEAVPLTLPVGFKVRCRGRTGTPDGAEQKAVEPDVRETHHLFLFRIPASREAAGVAVGWDRMG